jgi:hypothetical protein
MNSYLKPAALTALSLALLAALLPAPAQAQVVFAQPSVVVPAPVVVQSYYGAPVAPSISYYAAPAAYSYYPPTTAYYAAPAAYSVPATVAYPAGVYTTRTYQGFGIFRPRGLYTQSYYSPYVYVR